MKRKIIKYNQENRKYKNQEQHQAHFSQQPFEEKGRLIRMMAQKNGTTTLKDNCLSLVFAGVTTVDEMLRITYTID